MFLSSAILKVYGLSKSESRLSTLSQHLPVVNTSREAIHVQFLTRKLIFTIIAIAYEVFPCPIVVDKPEVTG